MIVRIVVLAGGLSPERDVSLASGSLVSNALMNKGHEVLLMDLYYGYKNTSTFDEAYACYAKQTYEYKVPSLEPNLKQMVLDEGREEWVGDNVISICQGADIVFVLVHGSMGENGKLQAILDSYQIRYTGSDYTGCLLSMNKIIAKEIMQVYKIPTARWVRYDESITSLPFPECVIKPVDGGSSIGVSIVDTQESFQEALDYAKAYSSEILIESRIHGREFSIGVLDDKALPVIEMIPKHGFYDYKNKYQDGLTEDVCPANIPEALATKLQAYALDVHHALRLKSYSRIDFMVSNTNEIFCLEANTLPGMTPTSLLPLEALAAGIEFGDLCEQIIQLSM